MPLKDHILSAGTVLFCSIAITVSVFLLFASRNSSESAAPTTENPLLDECFCENPARIILSDQSQNHTIQSPKYPQEYCNYHQCSWLVFTPDKTVIKLEWTDFHTEKNIDLVSIYDGETQENHLLQACSGSCCDDLETKGNIMLIKFDSDDITTETGFQAIVSTHERDPCLCYEPVTIDLKDLHEKFNLTSPNFPESYCPDQNCVWKASAPTEYGLLIEWNSFKIRNQDFVTVFDGNSPDSDKLTECSGGFCKTVLSSGNEMLINFGSASFESTFPGFSAQISVIINYCEKSALHVPLGSVTFSSEMSQTKVLIGAIAQLNCAANSKVEGSINSTTDAATCQIEGWSPLAKCIEVCQLSVSTEISPVAVNLCEAGEAILVPDDKTVKMEKCDFENELKLSGPHEFHCSNSAWSPDQPICHSIAILIFDQFIEFYSPNEHRTGSINFTIDTDIKYQSIAISPEGQIVIAGGNRHSFSITQTKILNPATGEVTEGPQMTQQRSHAAMTIFEGEPIICGGHYSADGDSMSVDPLNSCEKLSEHKWWPFPSIHRSRNDHAMVAAGQFLFVIGGRYTYGMFGVMEKVINLVERYSTTNDSWEFVAPMPTPRYNHGAAVFKDLIFVCGGIREGNDLKICEKYGILENKWQAVSSMNEGRQTFGLVVFAERLYALAGFNRRSIEVFDIEQNSWQKLEDLFQKSVSVYGAVVAPFKGLYL